MIGKLGIGYVATGDNSRMKVLFTGDATVADCELWKTKTVFFMFNKNYNSFTVISSFESIS